MGNHDDVKAQLNSELGTLNSLLAVILNELKSDPTLTVFGPEALDRLNVLTQEADAILDKLEKIYDADTTN